MCVFAAGMLFVSIPNMVTVLSFLWEAANTGLRMLFSRDVCCLQLMEGGCSAGGQDGTLSWIQHKGLTGTFKLVFTHSVIASVNQKTTFKQPLVVLLLISMLVVSN